MERLESIHRHSKSDFYSVPHRMECILGNRTILANVLVRNDRNKFLDIHTRSHNSVDIFGNIHRLVYTVPSLSGKLVGHNERMRMDLKDMKGNNHRFHMLWCLKLRI